MDRLVAALKTQSEDQFKVWKDRQDEMLEILYDRQACQNEALKAREATLFKDITAVLVNRMDNMSHEFDWRMNICIAHFERLEAALDFFMKRVDSKLDFFMNRLDRLDMLCERACGLAGHDNMNGSDAVHQAFDGQRDDQIDRFAAFERRLTDMETRLVNAIDRQNPVRLTQSGPPSIASARIGRPTPRTVTTEHGSPIRIRTNVRPHLNQVQTPTHPRDSDIGIAMVSSPGPLTPPSRDRLFTKPVIEGLNGVFYEMPDFMLEKEGVVPVDGEENVVEAAPAKDECVVIGEQ